MSENEKRWPADFWDQDALDYQREEHIEPFPTPEMIAYVEAELGYKLPESYVSLMQTQNGGIPLRTCHPTAGPTSWAEDHIAISSISGIGRDRIYSLCGDLGQANWLEEWEYPPIGVYFAHCPSGGHDMVALNYWECGPSGEPSVVHVEQGDGDSDFKVTWLAPNFATFINQLVAEDTFDDADS